MSAHPVSPETDAPLSDVSPAKPEKTKLKQRVLQENLKTLLREMLNALENETPLDIALRDGSTVHIPQAVVQKGIIVLKHKAQGNEHALSLKLEWQDAP